MDGEMDGWNGIYWLKYAEYLKYLKYTSKR